MASENVEVVRRALEAIRQQDLDAFLELADPDIELDFSRRLIDPTVLRGREGARRFIVEIFELFSQVEIRQEEVIEVGDKVIDVSVGRFTGMTSGIEATARAAIIWTLAGGKIVRFEFHQDRESALASAREERPAAKG